MGSLLYFCWQSVPVDRTDGAPSRIVNEDGEECQKEGELVAAEQTRPRTAGQHAEMHPRHLEVAGTAPERRIKFRRNRVDRHADTSIASEYNADSPALA